MVITQKVRLEPYTAGGEVHGSPLDFVKRHATLLSPDLHAPEKDWRTGTSRHLGGGNYETGWEFGSGEGYRVTLNETLESRASGSVERCIAVETFGLPVGCTLCLKYASSFAHPSYIELRVWGPEEVVPLITERFRAEFGPGADANTTVQAP